VTEPQSTVIFYCLKYISNDDGSKRAARRRRSLQVLSDLIIFEKAVDGVYYLVEAVPDVKKKAIYIDSRNTKRRRYLVYP
jgi:hypothetical protein